MTTTPSLADLPVRPHQIAQTNDDHCETTIDATLVMRTGLLCQIDVTSVILHTLTRQDMMMDVRRLDQELSVEALVVSQAPMIGPQAQRLQSISTMED